MSTLTTTNNDFVGDETDSVTVTTTHDHSGIGVPSERQPIFPVSSGSTGARPPSSVDSEQRWTFFGRQTQRSKVEFFSQVIILYIIIIACLVNITLKQGNRELWCGLLGSSIGYLLPSPRLKSMTKNQYERL